MKPTRKFVTIPAGEVEIEGKLIKVESFKLSNLCVTSEEFSQWVCKDSGPLKPNKPITNVNWFEAKEFAQAHGCRLPTEAEWQWAAQGGKLKQTWAGTSNEDDLEKFAWFDDIEREKPHRVGKKLPNTFGLYDMSGNVWEWCKDELNSLRMLRGGSWCDDPIDLQCAYRNWYDPTSRFDVVGFRVALI